MLKIMNSKQIKIKSKSKKLRCVICNTTFKNINNIMTCECPILIIQNTLKKYLHNLYSLDNITYNSQTLNYKSINSFDISTKKHNDINNKLRESIIGAIINDKIPQNYYIFSKRWYTLKNNIMDYIYSIYPSSNSNNITNISCVHKGGRKFNYDFEIKINDTIYNIELKFNAENIIDTPQFVSPMKPSQYLSSSFENYYYDNYLPLLANIGNIQMPNKETYLKEIHQSEPKCIAEFQKKYYNGCKKSSRFTGNLQDIMFYDEANRLSQISITNFIEKNELNIQLLTEHLKKTQISKHYMLYKHNKFYHQVVDISNYELVTYEKQPSKYRYIAKSKAGHSITILLRWKNGNGIAFPAFQIS